MENRVQSNRNKNQVGKKVCKVWAQLTIHSTEAKIHGNITNDTYINRISQEKDNKKNNTTRAKQWKTEIMQ
jgi:hypothetical protein